MLLFSVDGTACTMQVPVCAQTHSRHCDNHVTSTTICDGEQVKVGVDKIAGKASTYAWMILRSNNQQVLRFYLVISDCSVAVVERTIAKY